MIVSIGSVNVDVHMRVSRWPEPGETLFGHHFVLLGGGKGANVALLARRLGVPASLVGRIGDDPWCTRAIEPLVRAGVDLSHLRVAAGEPTGLATIFVRPDGEKAIVLAANANDAWQDLDDAARAVEEAADGSVVVADLEVPVDAVRRGGRAARRRRLPLVLDPSPAARVDDEILSLCTVVTPNASEAEALVDLRPSNAEEAYEAGGRLVARGAPAACVKFGRGDCAVVTREIAAHVRPAPVETIDTTGAGDAFAGALAVALHERLGLVDAARFGVASSNAAVAAYGSSPSYPDREELERRLAALPTPSEGTRR